MKTVPLSPTDRELYHATHKIIVGYADLVAVPTASTATGSFALIPASGTFPAGTKVYNAAFKISSNTWAATSMTSLTITIGDGGSATRFLASTEILLANTEVVHFSNVAATAPYTYLVADTVDLFFTPTGANTSALTAGEIEIYLDVETPSTDMANIRGTL